MKKINSRKVGVILAIIFIVGFAASTIYARGFAERHKPLVEITTYESTIITWSYESRGTAKPASDEFKERYDWMLVDVFVPREAYINDMDMFPMMQTWPVTLFLDAKGMPWDGAIATRSDSDEGVNLTIGFNSMGVADPHMDEGARVLLSFELDTARFMLPESAVHLDLFTNEYYIYYVTRHEGVWGREFRLVREYVKLSVPGRVGWMVNVIPISSEQINLPIVLSSDKDLYDGAVVRLYG